MFPQSLSGKEKRMARDIRDYTKTLFVVKALEADYKWFISNCNRCGWPDRSWWSTSRLGVFQIREL